MNKQGGKWGHDGVPKAWIIFLQQGFPHNCHHHIHPHHHHKTYDFFPVSAASYGIFWRLELLVVMFRTWWRGPGVTHGVHKMSENGRKIGLFRKVKIGSQMRIAAIEKHLPCQKRVWLHSVLGHSFELRNVIKLLQKNCVVFIQKQIIPSFYILTWPFSNLISTILPKHFL